MSLDSVNYPSFIIDLLLVNDGSKNYQKNEKLEKKMKIMKIQKLILLFNLKLKMMIWN